MAGGFRHILQVVLPWWNSVPPTHRSLYVYANDRQHMTVTASDRGHMNVYASDRQHMTVTAGDTEG